jgi:hypothetical protein
MNRLHIVITGFVASLLLLSSSAPADWLKVDISAPGQSGGAVGFENWEPGSTSPQTKLLSNGVTAVLTLTSPTPDATHYFKVGYDGKDGKTYNYRLAYDAIWPYWKDDSYSPSIDLPYPNGGAMSLTLTGLSTGPHNIVTYHNDPWATTKTWTANGTTYTNFVSDCNISVNGVFVKRAAQTQHVTSDAATGYAFFTVDAVEGTPVVIDMAPAANGTMHCVFLNGFEIDAPGEPSAMATVPVPADQDLHVNVNNDDPAPGHGADGYTTLSWTPSAFAVTHGVYFGTNQTTVLNATTSTTGVYFGTQTATTFPRTGLSSKYTYYWRIDETNTQGVTTKGAVWSFRARRLAYPGAVGYGRWAHGGRYGQVIEVTNLNDSGAGSLRDALQNHTGPRVVVFRVGGVIPLQSKLQILGGYGDVYIAGQTAPGSGIALTQMNIGPYGTKDVVIRHVRLRVGDYSEASIDGIGASSCDHVIIDHCSISWCLDVGHNSLSAGNYTFSNNIISESLYDSYHYNGGDRTTTETHSFAASIGGHNGTFYKNLLAHCTGRNWSLAGGLEANGRLYAGYVDIRNNVVYNWRDRTNDGGCKATNLVNNYYKGGPVTSLWWLLKLDGDELSLGDYQQAYVSGNKMIRQNGTVVMDPAGDNWSYCSVLKNATVAQCKSTTPLISAENCVTQTADAAYLDVLTNAGATLPRRDAIDTRVINDVRNATYTYVGSKDGLHGIIDTQDDVTQDGYAGYALVNHIMDPGVAPADTDHDGLPDWWETMKGLNPSGTVGDFTDSNGDPDNNGYTNLDEYLAYLDAGGKACGYGDMDGNCQVDFRDLSVVANAWAGSGSADVNLDGSLNYLDIARFAESWLTCNNSTPANCWQ